MLTHVEAPGASTTARVRVLGKFDWTPEAVDRLKALAKANELSASGMANVFGVTRNAIIGKLDRLKISIAKEHTRSNLGLWRKYAKRGPQTAGVKRWRALVEAANAELEAVNAEPVVEIAPPATAIASILELKQSTCRYPFGHPRQPGFCYCGGEAFAPFPYCAGHARLSYKPARER